ncbi:MAG: hypothetical protein IKV85_04225 [Ruminococcus sp.]|nr:hypothetical protein [Ruminococcus sp.]
MPKGTLTVNDFKSNAAGEIVVGNVEISELTFPDPDFRQYVAESFDEDCNGILSENEIFSVSEIDVAEKNQPI